jgi:hypothetical protein
MNFRIHLDGFGSIGQSAIAQIAIGQHFFWNFNCSTQKIKLLKSAFVVDMCGSKVMNVYGSLD